jgi:fructose-1,6-bisphosphatase
LLDIKVTKTHQRSGVVLGSVDDVNEVEELFKKHPIPAESK